MAVANDAQSLERARQIPVDLTSVPHLMGPTERCDALLADVLDRNEDYINFRLIQLDGDVSCSAAESDLSLVADIHALLERKCAAFEMEL